MRLLYVTDLHGSKWKYDRLFEAAKSFHANVVINGGDMLPGIDPFGQGGFIAGFLDGHFARFNSEQIYYFCLPANDDLMVFDQTFEEACNRYPFVASLAQRKIEVGDYEFIGMNWISDYPFRLKDRCRMDTDDYVFQPQMGKGVLSTSYGWKEIDDWFLYVKKLPTIQDELDRLVYPKDMGKSIYVIHAPPYGVELDKVHHSSDGVGSKALYKFLYKHQPKLALHGHIHESPEVTGHWHANIGRTLCIQPGQLDLLTYVQIDLSTMRFERIKERYIL